MEIGKTSRVACNTDSVATIDELKTTIKVERSSTGNGPGEWPREFGDSILN